MSRLPVVPPPLPDEALSSWIARNAARYDLSADALVRHLLPNEPSSGGVVHAIDDKPVPQLEAALAEATGQPGMDFAAHRFQGLSAHPEAAWSRRQDAWCPVCLFEDVTAQGEVHARANWRLGGYLLCTLHGCLLVSECPRCFDRISYQPIGGRLRLWCGHCETTVDDALEPSRIPFWPFGLPQQSRRCRTVNLTDAARPLLFLLQRTRLSALVGQHARAPWTRHLKREQVTDIVRTLCFIMLGPLWEDADRPALVRHEGASVAQVPEDWTPGSLPPFVAAPALLASVTFLAAENGKRLDAVTWNRQALLDGERPEINAETLTWHLNAYDAMLARTLLSPSAEPLAVLLSALRCDSEGLGTTREARRRRYGIGSVQRRRRATEAARLTEREFVREARDRRERCDPPADRYKLERLWPSAPSAPLPPIQTTHLQATVAVFATIGANGTDGDIVHRTGWPGTRMESRYVQFWITRHRDCCMQDLVAALVDALDRARAEDRGLRLPELVPKPIACPWPDAVAR